MDHLITRNYSSNVKRIALLIVLLLASCSPSAPPKSSPAVSSVQIDRDVVYREVAGHKLLADVYRPTSPVGPRPAIIFIHGGGWQGGDRNEFAQIAHLFAWLGYVSINITYRLVSTKDDSNRFPTQLDDVQFAVRWARANAAHYGINSNKVCAVGSSAGGHLAALLGVQDTRDNSEAALAAFSSRVNCVAAISAPLDLTQTFPVHADLNVDKLVRDFVGKPLDEQEAYQTASPITKIDSATAPFILFHSRSDSIIPFSQSQQFCDAMTKAGRPVAFVKWGVGHHGITDDGTFNSFVGEMRAFMEQHLK